MITPTHREVALPDQLPDPLPLVGRAPELSRLEGLLENTGSELRTVFIRGDGGVGKSRLVAELADRAGRRSWDVVRGRAYPVERGVPFAIYSDAWLQLLEAMPESTRSVLTRGGDDELRFLFPALGERPEHVREAAASDPEELRTRVMWNFAEFVKRLSARKPILCVLEDLHWSDQSSIELTHFLARQLVGHSVLLVCTVNDQERDGNPELVRAEQSLVGIGAAEVIRLPPLSHEQVIELVSRTFTTEPERVRELAGILFGWSRGNAFFLREMLRSLPATGRLRLKNGMWVGWDGDDLDLPPSIREAIRSNVRRLTEDAKAVADFAAVVGNRASYGLLQGAAGLDEERTLTALEELCARGLLDEHEAAASTVYEFRHPLVQQTLYDEFGIQRLRTLHSVVAEAMEDFYAGRTDQHVDELAYHFSRADASVGGAKAADYLMRAGERALARRAAGEAIAYLESARNLRTATDQATERDLDMTVALARAYGQTGSYDRSAELWHEVVVGLTPSDPRFARASRMLGLTHLWRGRHKEATAVLDAGLRAAEETGDKRANVRLLIARAHGLHEVGRADEALSALNSALPMAIEIGDEALLARVHRALSLLHVWVGPPHLAIEHGEEAIRLARSVGDEATGFWAQWGLAVLVGMRGDTEAMAVAMDELNGIADRLRSPVLRLWTADMSVELAYARGEWDRGLAEGLRSIELARRLRQRTLLPRLLVWTSQFHLARGELDAAHELVQEAVDMSGIQKHDATLDVHQVVPTYIGLVQYLTQLGDFEEAIDAAAKGLQIAEGTGYILWAVHQLLPAYAEACLWAGQIDRAEEIGERMRAHANRIDHRIGRAWADACESLVRWKRGDPAGAIDQMLAAADDLEAIPMLWTATRLRRQVAGRMLELGRNEEGLDQLRRVHDVCVSVGAGLELEKTRSMFREAGQRPPPVRRDGGPLGLTSAEARIASLVSQGMSNKAIASEIGCATRTVSTHLSNIYGKLEIGGPGGRVRLGNLAREAGLLEK